MIPVRDGRLPVRMVLWPGQVSVAGEHGAFAEALEAAAIIGAIFAEQIGRKLIDRDGNDQPWRGIRGSGSGCGLGQRGQGHQQQQGMKRLSEHLFRSLLCLDGATLPT